MIKTKLEHIFRSKHSKYQKVYNLMPPVVQNTLVSARGLHLVLMRYNKDFYTLFNNIVHHDRFTNDELLNYQNSRLQSLLKHAYINTIFYRKLFDQSGITPDHIKTKSDLELLPVISRNDISQQFENLVAFDKSKKNQFTVCTSGSSGAGIRIMHNSRDLLYNWAFLKRQLHWFGITNDQWRITLYGSKIVPENKQKPPFWRYNFFEKQILLSIFHLSKTTRDDYIKFLQSHSDMFLEGFASVLTIIANIILEKGISIPMKLVYSTGEPILDSDRIKVEKAFECKLIDCYGMTEWVGLIQECEKGEKHLISDYGILEILNKNNKPVQPGEEGYFVWTGLEHYAMPLIRYKIGDIGLWAYENKCSCGKPYPLVEPTITRDSDIIITAAEQYYSPRVLNQFLKDKITFKYCQFIQTEINKLIIRIVPGDRNYENDLKVLTKSLHQLFENRLDIEIEIAEMPIKRGNGKIPLIINHLKNR